MTGDASVRYHQIPGDNEREMKPTQIRHFVRSVFREINRLVLGV